MKKRLFPSFCRALTVFAYSLIAAQFVYLELSTREEPHGALYSLCYTLIFVTAGYCLQAAVSALFRFKRNEDTGLGIAKYISLPHLLLPVLIALIASIAFVMKRRADMLAAFEIDSYSLAPVSYGFPIFALALFGILIWFIPFGKLMTKQSMIPVGLVYFGVFVFAPFMRVDNQSFLTIGFLVYVAVGLFLINQAALEKYFRSLGGVSALTRKYNAFIAVVLLVCILLTFFAVLGGLLGAFSLAKSIITSLVPETEEEETAEEEEYILTEGTEVGEAEKFSMEIIPSKLLFVISSIFILGVAVVGTYIFIRNYRPDGRFRIFLYHLGIAIKDVLIGFAELIRRIFGFKFTRYVESYVPMSYHEERISISDISVREKSKPAIKNYSDFRARLEKLSDSAERYTYAYATMMTLARSHHSLKASNTPREATAHLLAQGWDESLPEQTENYEFTEYSQSVPSADKLEEILEHICAKVRTML